MLLCGELYRRHRQRCYSRQRRWRNRCWLRSNEGMEDMQQVHAATKKACIVESVDRALPQRTPQVQFCPMDAAATTGLRKAHTALSLPADAALMHADSAGCASVSCAGKHMRIGRAHLWKQQHGPEVCVPSSHSQHASFDCSRDALHSVEVTSPGGLDEQGSPGCLPDTHSEQSYRLQWKPCMA